MTKSKIYLPSIANLGASSAAGTVGLVDLPLFYKYHAIGFEYVDGGSSPQSIIYNGSTGLIGDIILKINANTKRTHSAQELDHLNSVNGAGYAAAVIGSGATETQVLRMNFSEPWRDTYTDKTATALNLTPAFGVSSAQVQITLGSAMPATGSLVLYAIVETPDQNVPAAGPLVKIVERQSLQASGTFVDVTNLPQAGYYQTVLLKNPSTTGYISKARLVNNGTIVRELTRGANIGELTVTGLNPATSTSAGAFGYDLVLDDDDPINSALPAAGQNYVLHLEFNTAAAGNVVALIERVQFGW